MSIETKFRRSISIDCDPITRSGTWGEDFTPDELTKEYTSIEAAVQDAMEWSKLHPAFTIYIVEKCVTTRSWERYTGDETYEISKKLSSIYKQFKLG